MENRKEDQTQNYTQEESRGQSKWIFIVSGLLLGSLVLCYFFVSQFQQFVDEAFRILSSDDQERIKQWVSGFGPWGPLFIVAAMVAQMFLIVIPSVVLMVVSTLAYGPLWGSLWSLVAVLVASSLAYFIGLQLGNSFVDKLIGKQAEEKVNGYIQKYGAWAIVLFRVSPFLSNDAISFVAGIGRMRYATFIVATAGGIAPLIGVIAYVGKDTDTLQTSMIWISAATAVAFVVYLLYRRHQKSKEGSTS